MDDENDSGMRTVALCERLGRTWLGNKIAVVDGAASKETESHLTLFD